MSFLNSENQSIALPEELDIFSSVPNQVAVEKAFYTECRPISSLSNEMGPIEFFSSGQSALYTDLSRTKLYLKCAVLHQDETPIADDEKISVINLVLQTLWNEVSVYLNGKLVSCQTCNYPYKSYIKFILNKGGEALNSQCQSQLYYKDENPGSSHCDPSTSSNLGLYKRSNVIKGSREFELEGTLLEDVFAIRKYLINGVDLYIKLNRNPTSFVLMTPEVDKVYKLKITDAVLKCLRIKVDPGVIIAHSKKLESKPARYQFMKSEVKTYNIPKDSSLMVWDNAWPNAVPKSVVIGLVSSAGLNGSLTRNPLFFSNFNVTSVGLYINGETYPHQPYKLDFDKKQYATAYQALFDVSELGGTREGLNIQQSDFAEGYALYVFSLAPGYFSQDHVNLIKQANTRLEIRFAQPLSEAVTCVALSEFNAELTIDKTRDVHMIQP